MDTKKIENIKILDCTIRDGGYLNNWQFDKKVVREVYRASSDAGVDIIELGFKSGEKFFSRDIYGTWRFCDEEEVREVTKGISGAKLGAMVDFGKIDVPDIQESAESMIDIIRVAVHKDKIPEAIKLIEQIKDKGYETSLQMMGYSTFTGEEQKDIINLLENSHLDYAYIADSYGSILPFQIKGLFEPLLKIPGLKVGFHSHNNLQMAFANTLEAINCGIHLIDGTIYGMGRGAGNLPIEIFLSYLQQYNAKKYNVIPILHCIDKYFVDFHKQMNWGYQLPYMISGIFNSHPYYAKGLMDSREYTIDDVWDVLEKVKEKRPVGFSEELLKDIVSATLTEEVNDKPTYINRHKGQDFLVLANGPNLKIYKDRIDDFIKNYNPIILGANYLGGVFIPHYHAFTNKRRFIDYIPDVKESSKLLLSSTFKDDFIKNYTERDYEKILHGIKKDDDGFKIIDGVIYSGYYTVSLLLIPVAHIMGAKRIFVVGMDGYRDLAKKHVHFYHEKDETDSIKIELEKERKSAKMLNDIQNYLISNDLEAFRIITPTSYNSHYEDIRSYL
jgi:4-hydroxy 2-oxovalerate aldolase